MIYMYSTLTACSGSGLVSRCRPEMPSPARASPPAMHKQAPYVRQLYVKTGSVLTHSSETKLSHHLLTGSLCRATAARPWAERRTTLHPTVMKSRRSMLPGSVCGSSSRAVRSVHACSIYRWHQTGGDLSRALRVESACDNPDQALPTCARPRERNGGPALGWTGAACVTRSSYTCAGALRRRRRAHEAARLPYVHDNFSCALRIQQCAAR
jgi:hypothetical protein